MANNAFYPVSPAPRTVAGVIKLDASRIAHWATIGATHAAIMGEHAMLFAGGKLLASDAPASTATHAVWVNVATREKMESKLATILRTVSGRKGEVKFGADAYGMAEKMAVAIVDAGIDVGQPTEATGGKVVATRK